MWATTVPRQQLDERPATMVAGHASIHPAMPWAPQTSPVEATDGQRERPPNYSSSLPDAAPQYSRELHERPIHTCYLRAPNKKSFVVVPYGPSSIQAHKIVSRGSLPFSKKPEIEVWRTIRADAAKVDEYVAGIWFDNDGPLPWCPRAHFVRRDSTNGDQTYRMEARNFSDWTISVNNVRYIWVLEAKPFSLVLRACGTKDTIARFNFSALGLVATGGAEAGDLSIWEAGLSQDGAGMDIILCSLVTAISQFKKMGRHYKNEPGTVPARELTAEERLPLHRTSIAPFWTRRKGDVQVDY